MNHITSPNEPYPSPAAAAQATRTHTQRGFTVTTRKLPILKAGPIDAMTARVGIPMPEMIFGDNLVAVAHARTGWAVRFRAEGALDTVDKTGEGGMLRVAYAREWTSSRERSSAADIREVVRPFDWSYSCAYRGEEEEGVVEEEEEEKEENARADGEKEKGEDGEEGEGKGKGKRKRRRRLRLQTQTDGAGEGIPVELLKRRDPILFADEVVLYESELDDNGISVLSVKVRVMEQRMLLLCRLFMRLDNVLVRVRDTRVYVDFERELVIREYTAREEAFDKVKRKLFMTGLRPDDVTVALKDSNQVANLLPIVEHSLENLCLAAKS